MYNTRITWAPGYQAVHLFKHFQRFFEFLDVVIDYRALIIDILNFIM